jgi:hypothetical protein
VKCCVANFTLMKTLVMQPEVSSKTKVANVNQSPLDLKKDQKSTTAYIKSTQPAVARKKGNPKLYIL